MSNFLRILSQFCDDLSATEIFQKHCYGKLMKMFYETNWLRDKNTLTIALGIVRESIEIHQESSHKLTKNHYFGHISKSQ